MKRNFVKIAFVVAIAMIAGVNVFNAHKQIELSDIAMANVEALADVECEYILSGPMAYNITYLWFCSWRCTPGGLWQCPM